MADARDPEQLVQAVVDLQAKIADLESTLVVRVAKRPTGDIEPTIRTVAKPNTLFMRGQTLNRVDYPNLWQFAEDNGLVASGLFTSGNGSTTFGMPNLAGRVVVGAADGDTIGSEIGANTKAITIANMPAHGHDIGGGTDNAGAHGGHVSVTAGVSIGGGSFPMVSEANGNAPSHWHGPDPLWADLTGDGTLFDVRQLGRVINWMIYT